MTRKMYTASQNLPIRDAQTPRPVIHRIPTKCQTPRFEGPTVGSSAETSLPGAPRPTPYAETDPLRKVRLGSSSSPELTAVPTLSGASVVGKSCLASFSASNCASDALASVIDTE